MNDYPPGCQGFAQVPPTRGRSNVDGCLQDHVYVPGTGATIQSAVHQHRNPVMFGASHGIPNYFHPNFPNFSAHQFAQQQHLAQQPHLAQQQHFAQQQLQLGQQLARQPGMIGIDTAPMHPIPTMQSGSTMSQMVQLPSKTQQASVASQPSGDHEVKYKPNDATLLAIDLVNQLTNNDNKDNPELKDLLISWLKERDAETGRMRALQAKGVVGDVSRGNELLLKHNEAKLESKKLEVTSKKKKMDEQMEVVAKEMEKLEKAKKAHATAEDEYKTLAKDGDPALVKSNMVLAWWDSLSRYSDGDLKPEHINLTFLKFRWDEISATFDRTTCSRKDLAKAIGITPDLRRSLTFHEKKVLLKFLNDIRFTTFGTVRDELLFLKNEEIAFLGEKFYEHTVYYNNFFTEETVDNILDVMCDTFDLTRHVAGFHPQKSGLSSGNGFADNNTELSVAERISTYKRSLSVAQVPVSVGGTVPGGIEQEPDTMDGMEPPVEQLLEEVWDWVVAGEKENGPFTLEQLEQAWDDDVCPHFFDDKFCKIDWPNSNIEAEQRALATSALDVMKAVKLPGLAKLPAQGDAFA